VANSLFPVELGIGFAQPVSEPTSHLNFSFAWVDSEGIRQSTFAKQSTQKECFQLVGQCLVAKNTPGKFVAKPRKRDIGDNRGWSPPHRDLVSASHGAQWPELKEKYVEFRNFHPWSFRCVVGLASGYLPMILGCCCWSPRTRNQYEAYIYRRTNCLSHGG